MKKTFQPLLLAGAIALVFTATGFAISKVTSSNDTDNSTVLLSPSDPNQQTGAAFTVASHPALDTDFTKAAESTINGVVSIKSFATPRASQGFSDPFFDFFFGGPGRQQPQRQQEQKQQPMGLGSGVIISADGYIVTNNHVIDGAEKLEITLNDNRTFNATVIGADPSTELALIKIEAND
ncbi:MAG: S1C family serine protease, partial [Paramuribaculum sp.]|nr:S1C family serine protease [Paramuribaculum sp.]